MADSNQTQTDQLDFVSDNVRAMFEVAFNVIICGSISLVGSFANVINIIVFVKQGLGDTVNISFFALAVSDLGSLLSLVWESIVLNPWYPSVGINIEQWDLNYITAGVPHGIFVRIAWWITTFITFERCLCIAMPLKVKDIISPKVTAGVMISITIIIFLGMSPLFFATSPRSSGSVNNSSLLVRVYIANGAYVEAVVFTFSTVSQFGAVLLDMVFTIIIVQHVNVKSKWRDKYTKNPASEQQDNFTTRDQKLVKMVTLISVIFIVCLMPSCVNFLLEDIFTPDYTCIGKYRNTNVVLWSVILTIEAVNSSVTIIVYYSMSARYKGTLQELFLGNKVI